MIQDEKAKFDATMALSNAVSEKWAARREIEWKVTFLMLGAFAALDYAIITKSEFRDVHTIIVAAVIAIMTVAYVVLLEGIRRRNGEDARFSRFYLIKCEELAGYKPRTTLKETDRNRSWWQSVRGNYTYLLQVIATLVLAAASVTVQWNVQSKPMVPAAVCTSTAK